jgi:hypothetical protein
MIAKARELRKNRSIPASIKILMIITINDLQIEITL